MSVINIRIKQENLQAVQAMFVMFEVFCTRDANITAHVGKAGPYYKVHADANDTEGVPLATWIAEHLPHKVYFRYAYYTKGAEYAQTHFTEINQQAIDHIITPAHGNPNRLIELAYNRFNALVKQFYPSAL